MEATPRRTALAKTRTELVRRAILDAARTEFLANGYPGTTMDQIAARAAASKQTIYNQFTDKANLLTELITADIAEAEQRSQPLLDDLAATSDLDTDLRRFARQHIDAVLQPHLIRMRRLIISEAERFPHLARAWAAHGPERGHATLADLVRHLADRGLLRAADPAIAAQHLNWLILSIPLNRAMFDPDATLDPTDAQRYADEAVRIFLGAYGT